MLLFKAIMDDYALRAAQLQGDTQLYYVITGFPRILKHGGPIFHSKKLSLYIISLGLFSQPYAKPFYSSFLSSNSLPHHSVSFFHNTYEEQ